MTLWSPYVLVSRGRQPFLRGWIDRRERADREKPRVRHVGARPTRASRVSMVRAGSQRAGRCRCCHEAQGPEGGEWRISIVFYMEGRSLPAGYGQ